MISIRQFDHTPADYSRAVSLRNQVWADYPDTVVEWQENDSNRPAYIRWARFLAEIQGDPVGLASFNQYTGMYHPQKFWINLDVLPQHRRQGIGTALYEHILQVLDEYDPIAFTTATREDFADGMKFLTRCGFEETMREWESRLDPRTVDLAQWRKYEVRTAAEGIQIKTLRELEHDPERNRKLYELEWQLEQDVPEPDAVTKPAFEDWVKVLNRRNLLPDGWFVAICEGEYVGMSNLWRSQSLPGVLHTGLTGVLRSQRRKGIATALKLQGIRYAQEERVSELRTWNEVNNEGMLAINQRLGFVRQPAHIFYTKTIREEAPIPVVFERMSVEA